MRLLFFVIMGVWILAGSARGEEVPDIVINEIMWAKAEYIELYNNGDTDVSLDGWKITRQDTDVGKENLDKPQVRFENGDIIPSRGFFLVESSEDATTAPHNKIDSTLGLVDTGALLRLRDADDNIVDSANRFGSWFAGKHTTVGESMERIHPITDGENESSWHTSVGVVGGRIGTPGQKNSDIVVSTPTPTPTSVITPTPTSTPIVSHSSDVHINEFLPNPVGPDTELEFIELYNSGDSVVDLSGWVLDDIEDAGSTPFFIPDGTVISGNGYVVFYRTQTKIAMNNDSDHVRLIRPDGIVQGDVAYTSTIEGHSYNRTGAGMYEQSSTTTAGAVNIFTAVVTPTPKPVDDSEEELEEAFSYDYSTKIFINEILPNPIGSDTELEFIELKSEETRVIQLFGWTLDDEDGGSSPYRFTKEDKIDPGKIIVLFRTKTKLALNNDGDEVRLIDPNGKIISHVQYGSKVVEGQSYNRTSDGSFVWSDTPTPNEKNIISIQEEESITPKPKPTKKPSAPKKAASPKKAISPTSNPRVLSAVGSMLPWPTLDEEGVVSRTSVSVGKALNVPAGKPRAFVFFGVTVACVQAISGMLSKEKIWQK